MYLMHFYQILAGDVSKLNSDSHHSKAKVCANVLFTQLFKYWYMFYKRISYFIAADKYFYKLSTYCINFDILVHELSAQTQYNTADFGLAVWQVCTVGVSCL